MPRLSLILPLFFLSLSCSGEDHEKAKEADRKAWCEEYVISIFNAVSSLNYCEVDNDCVVSGFSSPHFCYYDHNKDADVSSIDEMVELFDKQCEDSAIYDCSYPQNIHCAENKCKSI